MYYAFYARESLLHDNLVSHVPADDFSRFGNSSLRVAMNLFDQGVQDPDLITLLQKFFRDMTTNKAASAGHKNLCHEGSFVDKLATHGRLNLGGWEKFLHL
jgi:hypothetical protein